MPLRGIRVLDFSRHLPGPYATDLLVRLGAEVIKIEPPDGDPTRWLPPFQGDYGALFTLVNGGKESVVADLKSEQARAFVRQLAAGADVVVESYRPGVADRLGIGSEALRAGNERLVYCSISGYGRGSARSSHDLNFVALAGLLDLQRDANGKPVLPSTQIGDMAGALFAALAIVAALFERQTTGRGKNIDISMSDATRAFMPTAEALYRGTRQTPETFVLTGALASYNVYRASDGGYIAAAPLEPHFWELFCRTIGHPEMTAQQYDESLRHEHMQKITAAIGSRTRAEWEEVFSGIDACVEPVLTIEESHTRFGDPAERHPLRAAFGRSAMHPVAALGESLEKVAAEAGYDAKEIRRMRRSGDFSRRQGLKRFIETAVAKRRLRKRPEPV
jgi:alpha-methylacyl-CoA racemase